jgi:hypothetical protein
MKICLLVLIAEKKLEFTNVLEHEYTVLNFGGTGK